MAFRAFLPLVYRKTDVFGIDENGVSRILHVLGWKPNFVVRATSAAIVRQQCCCESVDVRREPEDVVDYYEFEQPRDGTKYFRVSFRTSWDAMQAKKNWIRNSSRVRVYDAHLADASQMFVQAGIRPSRWIDASRFAAWRKKTSTTCTEHSAHFSELRELSGPSPGFPLKSVSFDIECDTTRGFPESHRDAVLQIGVVEWTAGTFATSSRLHAFMLETEDGTTQQIPPDTADDLTDGFVPEEAVVHSYASEIELLRGFEAYLRQYDPDLLTGYNINGFDLPYVTDRYSVLTGGTAFRWSRSCQERSEVQAFRRGSEKLVNSDRIVMDAMKVVKQDHSMRSYKLDNVCGELLGVTKKHDVAYDQIGVLQRTREGRGRMMRYCLKDCWLVGALLERLRKITNALQMSQVSGVFLQDVLDRGGQLKVLTSIYYALRDRPVRLPNDIPRDAGTYQGATVLEPTPGMYTDAVPVMDFASLYPSVMREYNMSPDTLIDQDYIDRHQLRPDQYVRVPDFTFDATTGQETAVFNPKNPIFLTERKGILIELLEHFLDARRKAKKRMNAAETDEERAIWNGIQLAYKVLCNTVYGFLGATGSMAYLPQAEIAACITKVGRDCLMRIKAMSEHLHARFPGMSWPAWTSELRVIYGDTDSVFVRCPGQSNVAEVEAEMIRMAEAFTLQMARDPGDPKIVLEYEKTYCPFLLQCKKRYVGKKYEPGRPAKMHCKGIELARRDFAPVVNETMAESLHALLMEADTCKCIDVVRRKVKELYAGRTDLGKLVITKQLTKNPEEYSGRVVHAELAKRIGTYKCGDRVPYVIAKPASAEEPAAWQRAKTPEEVADNLQLIDYQYYINNQLRDAMLRILQHVVPHADLLFTPPLETSMQRSIVACMGGPPSPSAQCKRLLENGHVPGVRKKRRIIVRSSDAPQFNTLTKWLKA